jgi:hypothetical protein
VQSDPGPLAWPAVVASAPTRHFCRRVSVDVFSATSGDRSRATVHSHPDNPVPRHILAAKLRALRRQEPATELRRQERATELRRREPEPGRFAVSYKPGLRRQALQRRPVEVPALRTPRQVVPVLRSHRPTRRPLKIPKRLLQEREPYSSLISLVVCGCRARHI